MFSYWWALNIALSTKINISFEIAHRFTTTDYLDDVSTTYIGVDKFPAPTSVAAIFQDRLLKRELLLALKAASVDSANKKINMLLQNLEFLLISLLIAALRYSKLLLQSSLF